MNFTKLMARLFNRIGHQLVWKDVAAISMVKTVAGVHTGYLSITENWFAFLAAGEASSPLKQSEGLPTIHLIITDGTAGMTQANMDVLTAVEVKGNLYKKERVYPPIGGEPRYWLIELQTTGHPWTPTP